MYGGGGKGSSYKDIVFVVPGTCFMTSYGCGDPHREFVSKHSCIGSWGFDPGGLQALRHPAYNTEA